MTSPRIYWHREMAPSSAQPMGDHVLEATSGRVRDTLERRDDLWDPCYRELMAHATQRLGQEVVRLGGDCAHVLAEHVEPRRDERTGEAHTTVQSTRRLQPVEVRGMFLSWPRGPEFYYDFNHRSTSLESST